MANAQRASDPTLESFIDELGKMHAGSRSELEKLSQQIEEEVPELTITQHDRQRLLQAYVRACGVLAKGEVSTWMRGTCLAIEGRKFAPANPAHLL